jgi:hypothetical protein
MSELNLKLRHAKRQNAQNLDLSNLEIESVPVELFQLKSLLILNLSNNKISEIDKQIENLKNLSELNLENNNISNLPVEILNLPNLSKLNLSNNPINGKLKDFNLNWKISLKEFFAGNFENEGIGNKEQSDNITTDQNGHKDKIIQQDSIKKTKFDSNGIFNKDRVQSAHSKNVPFSFNMSNIEANNLCNNKLNISSLRSSQNSLNNPNQNLNKSSNNLNHIKKDNIITSNNQIPNCMLFDSTYYNKNFKIKQDSEISSNPVPVRLHTAALKHVKIMDRVESNFHSNPIHKLSESKANELNDKNPIEDEIERINNTENQLVKSETADNNHKLKEEHYDSLNKKVSKYEEEIKIIKINFSKKEEEYKYTIKQLENEIKSLKSKSESQGEKKVGGEKIIHNKRNWMDHETVQVPNPNLPSNNSIGNVESESKIKDLENQLQKEVQTTKRMKNEIERLNKQLLENRAAYSSDEMIKSNY